LTEEERTLLNDISNGQYVLSIHAVRRMDERGVFHDDIVSIADTAFNIEWQQEHKSFRIDGYDQLSDEMTIAARRTENNVLIITVF
jgi:hypothetical protein